MSVDREKVIWGFIIAIPSIIIGMLPLAFPRTVIWIIGGLVAFWIACGFSWLVLRVRTLQSELEKEKKSQKPLESTGWETLEEVDLFLEGWRSTQVFTLQKDDKIRVTASGPKRFIVHLASDLSTKRFKSLKKTSETKSWTGTWETNAEGSYAIVLEPAGGSPFWVRIRVDRKQNRFAVTHSGKVKD
jgi:hypothetical protein